MAVFAAFVVLSMAASVHAQETVTVKGMINAEYDETYDNVVSAQIRLTDGATINIVMDENGKKMSQDMDYADVEVIGEIVEEDGVKWLKVASWKAVDTEDKPDDPVEEGEVTDDESRVDE